MRTAQLNAWLTLILAPGLGSTTLKKCFDAGFTTEQIGQLDSATLKALGVKANSIAWLQNPNQQLIDKHLDWLEQDHHHLITLDSSAYPVLLNQTKDKPCWLFAIGRIELLQFPNLAIVGSRNPTRAGSDSAFQFAKELAEQGMTIASGMALGVDTQAHRGALSVIDSSPSSTIAVVGTGLNICYPKTNRYLMEQISQQGLLISEYALDTQPKAFQFPARNRILAGLSLGTLVVEAAQKSGSLITARLASENNREVFALPGSIHNPLAKGCHQLIKQGASLVESAQEIQNQLESNLAAQYQLLTDLSQSLEDQPTAKVQQPLSFAEPPEPLLSKTVNSNQQLEPVQQQILNALDYEPQSMDQLVHHTQLPIAELNSQLPLLELLGLVALENRGYVKIT